MRQAAIVLRKSTLSVAAFLTIASAAALASSAGHAQPIEKRCGGASCEAVEHRLQSQWPSTEARIKSNPGLKAAFERALNRNDTAQVARILRENGLPEVGAYRLLLSQHPGGATPSRCKVVYHEIRLILSDGRTWTISWQEIIC